jgi:molybdopterin-guanine dinucleotide biosynthesis protein A
LDIEAYILIGGRSRRFGSDKAFFELEGESLAARAVRTLEAVSADMRVTFVASSEEQFGIKLKSLERPVIFDPRKGFGAWSGLDAALWHSGSEWTIVMACDLPFVSAGFLLELVDRATASVDAVVPRQSDGRLQPLCAVYRTRVIRALVDATLGRETVPPLAGLFDHVRSVYPDAPADVLLNVNTPGDIA